MMALRAPFFLKSIIWLAAVFVAVLPFQSSAFEFKALCYHDVSQTPPRDAYGVTVAQLKEQFDFLKANYKVVSLDDIIAASEGKKALPPKAVLITFDDGLGSFYELVYPLLKKYQFPAVFAVVGKWTEEGKSPDYGYANFNPPMASWKQLKEMSDSGLVAIVSHSYNMHYGHVFNPQGNEQAAAGFLKFSPETKTYESETTFKERVKADLKENDRLIRQHIGKTYPVMVWPYGTFNGLAEKAAQEVGLTMQFSIENGLNNTSKLGFIYRGMILSSFSQAVFSEGMKTSFVHRAPVRAVAVDLDSLWAGSEEESNKTLGTLNDRAAEIRPNVAIIQAFSTQGEAYFPTSQIKVKANFFPRVAHVLQNRSRIEKVYARVPLKVLKDKSMAERLIYDLALYSDIDGIFFDAEGLQVSKKEELVERAMKTGKALRPLWSFGLLGISSSEVLSSPVKERFKYIVKDLNLGKTKTPLATAAREVKDPQTVVTVVNSEAYKKWRDLGANHFFLSLSLNSYEDLRFLKDNFHAESNPFSLP